MSPGDSYSRRQGTYTVVAWCDGHIVEEWRGDDEVLARDAGRELFARGYDVELFQGARWLGWIKRADGSLQPW